MKSRPTKRRSPTLEFLEKRALLAAGTLDPTFGGGTGTVVYSTTIGPIGGPFAPVAVQSDLKTILANNVGGDEITGSTDAEILVDRYNVDGSLDTTFGKGGEVELHSPGQDLSAYTVQVETDGKIVIGGAEGNGLLIVRLNADGSLDNTFNGTGMVTFEEHGSDW